MPSRVTTARPGIFVARAVRRLSLLLVLAIAALTPSVALADSKAPALQSGSATPRYSFATQQVTATFRVTDDDSGVSTPVVKAISRSAPITTIDAKVSAVSGTGRDNTYAATITIPTGAVGGSWIFYTPQLADRAGNVNAGPWEIADFFVIGVGFDTTAPALVGADFAPKAVDLAAGAAPVLVTLRVKDDYTGARTPTVELVAPNGTVGASAPAALASGDKLDGVWAAKLVVPAETALGTWTVRVAPLADEWGNVAASATAIGQLSVTRGGATGATPTPTPVASPKPSPDQGGVLGTRANSRSYLAFAGKGKRLSVNRRGTMKFAVKCYGFARCRGSVKLYVKVGSKRVKVVARRVSIGPNKTVKATFKLTKSGRNSLRRGKPVKTSVSIWTDGIAKPRTKALMVKRA